MKPPRIGSHTVVPRASVREGETYLCVSCRKCRETIALMWIVAGANVSGRGQSPELEATCRACGYTGGYLLEAAERVRAVYTH